MKKHAREALKMARKIAQAAGFDAELLREQTSDSHLRFSVTRDGREVGRFTMAESPRCPSNAVNKARQSVKRLLRALA